MSERIDVVADLARELAPAMVELRRAIHAQPELGWSERATTNAVARALAAAGVQLRVRPDGVGGVAEVGMGRPIVGFRADLDALPVYETNTVPYRSRVPGVMHACGHDVHTAVAVGIGAVLGRMDDVPGTVRLVFQPAEERIPGGATVLAAEGVHRDLDALIAFHVDPALAVGRVGARVGPITSASDRVAVRLSGPGGHTSRPHQTVDLLEVAGRVLTDMPTVVRSGIDPRHPVVVVFGRIGGGSAENVIPTEVEIGGTVRVFDPELWQEMPKLVERAVAAIVEPHGADFELEYAKGSPPVVNDPGIAEAFAAGVRDALGDDGIVQTHQSLGSEDLAWYLQDIPGAMFRLGAAIEGRAVDLHSASFDVDERCIELGMRAGVAALLHLMEA